MGMLHTSQATNFNSTPTATKCRIHPGDALSPLLLHIGLNPQIINSTGYGNRVLNGAIISHLLRMDDIQCDKTLIH